MGGKSLGVGGEGKNMRVTRGLQEKFINLGLSECISSFLKQKLECLNRTQKKSLNFDFWRVTSKEKLAVSSCEIAGKFRWLPGLIENPAVLS